MTRYWLHYIGKGLYSAASFEEEAARHGVARAFPRSTLARMRYGDPILLGQFEGDPLRTRLTGKDGKAGRFEHMDGKAHVFGVFRIAGLNVKASDNATRDAFDRRLTILSVRQGEPEQVERACGSYSTGGITIWVADDIPDLCRKATEAEAETGGRLRFFATGPFHPIAPHLLVDPVRFNRAPIEVDLTGYDLADPPAAPDGRAVVFIFDYEQRTYIPKAPEASA